MKNAAQKYFSSIKNVLPGWNGADIGHTAARDWYVSLVLTTALGVGLVVFGVFRFFETSQTITNQPEGMPAQGFPANEAQIIETKNRFDVRAAEFQAFSTNVPSAPNPGQEKVLVEPLEENLPASSEVVE